jgi:hypothetical protein
MILEYNEFLNNEFIIECYVDEEYLLKITNKSNVIEAIKNEMNWIETIKLLEIIKQNGIFLLKVNVDDNIIQNTDAHDKKEGIYYEFQWLLQSGIKIKMIQ